MRRQSPSTSDEDLKKKIDFQSVKRLISLAAPHRTPLIVAGLLMLLGTATSLGLPVFVRWVVEEVIRTHNVQTLDRSAVAMLCLIVLGVVFGYIQYIIAARAGNQIVTDLRRRLFSHLQRLPTSFFDRTRSGDLTSHLSNDVSMLQITLTDDLVKITGHVITLIGGVVLAFYMNWQLALIVVSMLIAAMALFVFLGRRLRQLSTASVDALSDAMGTMNEALSNMRLVKAFVRERYEDQRAGEKLDAYMQLSLQSARGEGTMGSIAAAGSMIMLVACMWYGARGVLDDPISLAKLLGFIFTIFVIMGPMAQLASLYTRLQRAVGAADRLFALLDETPELPDAPGAVAFPDSVGAIRFDRVSFRYSSDVPIISDLDLFVPGGSVTALVGPSGAGKTTLASLLFRFYEPTEGGIEVDGIDIRQIRRESLREHIGIVPQEPILFNGTLAENIRYGRLDATDAEIEEAARQANVAEFVSELPLGYATLVGERGVTLSGGQRQRVAIARAMLKDPRILILDEATSALDTVSESLVREALDRLMQGRTTLIIAHRLSTIQNADQIVVLSRGRVVETGRHQELVTSGGTYAELYALSGS